MRLGNRGRCQSVTAAWEQTFWVRWRPNELLSMRKLCGEEDLTRLKERLITGMSISSRLIFWMKSAGRLLTETGRRDRKSTRLNSSHANISYAVFCLKK